MELNDRLSGPNSSSGSHRVMRSNTTYVVYFRRLGTDTTCDQSTKNETKRAVNRVQRQFTKRLKLFPFLRRVVLAVAESVLTQQPVM